MHKVAASWLGWCRRHVIITNLLVWTLELCAAVLVWLFADVSNAFPTAGTYIFFWLTLFAAFTAALNSVFASMSAHDSLTITNRGLELTRATQRPFLNSSEPTAIFSQSGSDEGQLQYILFQIANTGVFPADGVTVVLRHPSAFPMRTIPTSNSRIPTQNDLLSNPTAQPECDF